MKSKYTHECTYKGIDISLTFDPECPPQVAYKIHSGEKVGMISGIFLSKRDAIHDAKKCIDGFKRIGLL